MLRYTTSSGVEVTCYPSDERAFKAGLLDANRVYVLQVFQDGSTKQKVWNPSNFTEASDVRGNINTGYARLSRNPGLSQVHLALRESDLPRTEGGSKTPDNVRLPLLRRPQSADGPALRTPTGSRVPERTFGRRSHRPRNSIRYFVRHDCTEDDRLPEVKRLAEELRSYMNSAEVFSRIVTADVKGASSLEIQKHLTPFFEENSFREERFGLFANVVTNKIRPDFYKPLGPGGILVEVERGKTLHNNMDLLDVWKCHICERADFLFLIVPDRRAGTDAPVFDAVCNRISAFFKEPNYVNVKGVWVFGF